MSSAFLCVQFRNLLPSEQLVLLARALWSEALAAGVRSGPGDAVLSIAQLPGEPTAFEAELTLPGLARRGPARDGDARAAVDAAFARWLPVPAVAAVVADGSEVDKSATAAWGG